jgi:hypothetical protein
MSECLDKFLRFELGTLDEAKKYLTLRFECFDLHSIVQLKMKVLKKHLKIKVMKLNYYRVNWKDYMNFL